MNTQPMEKITPDYKVADLKLAEWGARRSTSPKGKCLA